MIFSPLLLLSYIIFYPYIYKNCKNAAIHFIIIIMCPPPLLVPSLVFSVSICIYHYIYCSFAHFLK